jgi:hypothetical protein
MLFSSSGFYFLSVRYALSTLAEFLPRLESLFPGTLGTMALYVAAAAVVCAVRVASRRPKAEVAYTLSRWRPQ